MPANKATIEGVVVKDLVAHLDGRGEVTELWSEPWVEQNNLLYPKHVYQSATDYGVVKCWHLHDIHTDQFTVTRGKLQVSWLTCAKILPVSVTPTPSFWEACARA